MLDPKIAQVRTDYIKSKLSYTNLLDDPINQFLVWYEAAEKSGIIDYNAMTLASCGNDGQPDARIVLLKSIFKNSFIFFTNYHSAKGNQLRENPKASLVFYWKELERQVRIKGIVSKVPSAVSDEYFYSRPIGSQVSAIISEQSSQLVLSKEEIEQKAEELMANTSENILRPEYWGGYALAWHEIEFWQGRASRFHDRFLYKRDDAGSWQITQLQP